MTPPTDSAATRLALYRRAARALNRFFSRWTAGRCAGCLELTRRHHRGDPRADVDLVSGIFPGCCHAGVADALWLPGEGRFPEPLAEALAAARGPVGPAGEPPAYAVRERQTGRVVRGVACVWLGEGGCRLGDLKAPLCLGYLCAPVRRDLAGGGGEDLIGTEDDDFCGAKAVVRAVVLGPVDEARRSVGALEGRLARLHRRLERGERGRAPAAPESDEGGERHG